METRPKGKISKRQIFYVSFAVLFATLALVVTGACWKVHTIRLAETSGLALEGTRYGSSETKIQKFDSALESVGIPENTRKPIASWLLQLAWKTDTIEVEETMSPKLDSILARREFKNIEALIFRGRSDVDLNDLAAIGPKPKCRFLDLEHAELNDSCVPVIVKNFPHVEFINFKGVPVGGIEFGAFSNHKGKTLGLNLNNNVAYTRENLETLVKACPRLGYLRVNMNEDETCEPLLQSQNLWGLDLSGIAVRGDIVHQLHRLPKLKWLSIGPITPNHDLDGALSSPPIPTVERLNLRGFKIEDHHIPQIARVFPNVKELWLPYCTLSPKSIADLSQLKSLRILKLNGIKLKEGKPTVPIRLPITSLWIDGEEKASLLKIYPSLSPIISRNSSEWIDVSQHPFFESIDY